MTIEQRLEGAPALRLAREAIEGTEGVWVVGGAVRAAALDRDVDDLDLTVPEGEEGVARALAAAASGHAFPLSGEFATWRVVDAQRSPLADVTRLRGDSIEADLAARDFSVGAIAVPLRGGEPLDPYGGLEDIRRGVLRAVSERSFADDPLRLLRAARLSAELGLTPDRATIALARSEAPRAGEPAGERQFAELRRILAGADPLRGLELMDELGVTPGVLPELEALRGVQQTPNHHLDVYGHTIEVLRQLLEVESGLERYAGERAAEVRTLLDEPLADELSRGDALRLAAVVHDIGKPATKQQRDSHVTFIGHDREGAEIVAGLCRRLRVSGALRSHLKALTRQHLRLGFMVHERPLRPRRVYDYLTETDPVSADVTLLTVADRLASRGTGPVASEEMIEAHLELAREMLAAALDWRREGPPRPPLAGDELAAEVGIEPGPELGELLAEIEAAQYAGEVSSREDAVAFARRRRG